MAFYVGGDTTELEYDFYTKTAGSSIDCPLKIYKGEVDPAALPSPTDPLWAEIISQSVIDKLKAQNEIVTSNLAVDKSTIQWGDKTLTKTATVKIVDDFVGKVAGSVVENPNRLFRSLATSLVNPSNVGSDAYTQFKEYDSTQQTYIDNIKILNGISNAVMTNAVNQMPQQLISKNIIEIYERKFGTIPKETVVEKVAWLKSNLKEIKFNAYVYGSNPTGNKANLTRYDCIGNIWNPPLATNTSSFPTGLFRIDTSSDLPYAIDANGFTHLLVYTDKARTTDSTLLVLTGHGLSQWDIIENTTRSIVKIIQASPPSANVIVTPTIIGQISGDIVNKYHSMTTSKIAETGTNDTTLKITGHGLAIGVSHYIKTSRTGDTYSTPIKVTATDANTLTLSSSLSGQTIGDTIYLFAFIGTQTAESTVIPSTIYTDYVSIELTLKAPENLITATNTLSDIVTDYNGKVAGSVVENANIYKHSDQSSTLLVPSSFTNESVTSGYTAINSLNGSCSQGGTVNVNGRIAQQLFSFNIISAVEKQLGQPIPATDKVQWCKDNVSKITCDWYGYGSCPSGNKAYMRAYANNVWNPDKILYHSINSPSVLSYLLDTSWWIQNAIQSDGFIHMLAYTDASDGVTASTIYTDYVRLTIKLKYIPTYDFYTDVNTRRDAGLTDIVLVKRQIGDMTSDYTGKVSGSVVENPNIAKYLSTTSSTLQIPSAFISEWNTTTYGWMNSLNGICVSSTETLNGKIPQQLFSFNLIAIAEKQLGTSIPGADTAIKVQWLKDNINSIICDWTGYGSCPSGNKAIITIWTGSAWSGTTLTNNTSSPSKLSYVATSDKVQSDGFFHLLAYTDASNGTIASTIYTDYAKITLTFKSDTLGYEFFTNNSSEISVTTNNKASAFLIECDLTPIATALYGGSNASLRNAIKSISSDIYVMGSGANVNQLGYGVTTKLRFDYANGTLGTSGWSSLSQSNITNSTSSIGKISPYITDVPNIPKVPTIDNKVYFIVYSNYKSDGTIASEVNLDYANIKVKLARTPDIPMYYDKADGIYKDHIPREYGEEWSAIFKGLSFAFDTNIAEAIPKYIIDIVVDASNRFMLYYDKNLKKFAFGLVLNGTTITVYSGALTFNKFTCFDLLISKTKTGCAMYALQNNGVFSKVSNTDTRILTGMLKTYIGTRHTNDYQGDTFVDYWNVFFGKIFTDEEAEIMLRGRNTIVGKETDAHLNELATMFQNLLIPTGFILPNNRYKVTGQAKLYCNGYYIRTVQDTEFTTSKYENKIELVGAAEVRRLD